MKITCVNNSVIVNQPGGVTMTAIILINLPSFSNITWLNELNNCCNLYVFEWMIILKRTNQFIASYHWRPKLSGTSGFRYNKTTKLILSFHVDPIEQIISGAPCES